MSAVSVWAITPQVSPNAASRSPVEAPAGGAAAEADGAAAVSGAFVAAGSDIAVGNSRPFASWMTRSTDTSDNGAFASRSQTSSSPASLNSHWSSPGGIVGGGGVATASFRSGGSSAHAASVRVATTKTRRARSGRTRIETG